MSFTAAGVAAAAETKTTPVEGKAGVRTDGNGHEISYPLLDKQGKPVGAARITLTIGDNTVDAYCIDLHTKLQHEKYQETGWEPSRVKNLEKVQWILIHSLPNIPATDVIKAAHVDRPKDPKDKTKDISDEQLDLLVYAAAQGAIWHFSDGFDLTDYTGKGDYLTGTYGAVQNLYGYLVKEADKASKENEPAPTLSIAPADATGEIGTKLGPYTVKSPAKPATLSVDGGKIVDANGAEITGPVADGGKFWLTRDTAGKVTVDAKAEGVVPTGRVFTYKVAPNEAQKVILAGKATTNLTAHAGGTFTPKAAPAPTLPVTGASAVGAAVGGLVLLGGGGVLVAMLRRRRINFTA